jgi:hypothetical protein
MRGAVVLVCMIVFGGCFAGGMESNPIYTGKNPRTDGVLEVAARETSCSVSNLRIVAETGRKYVNETAFRFVIEGCGERLGFIEQCALHSLGPESVVVNDSLSCRYLLVSRVPLRPSARTPTPFDGGVQITPL